MIELDVLTTADGELVIMHDSTVDRTTNRTGNVVDFTIDEWLNMTVDDIGNATGAKPAIFGDVIKEFGNHAILIIEPKDTTTGLAVIDKLTELGVSKDLVILQSFSASIVNTARSAGWTGMWLTGVWTGTQDDADTLALTMDWIGVQAGTTVANLDRLQLAGIKTAAYTFYTRANYELYKDSLDAFFADDCRYVSSSATRRTTDNFDQQTFNPGHHAMNGSGANGAMGVFTSPDLWGFRNDASYAWAGAFLGWASPLSGSDVVVGNHTMEFDVVVNGSASVSSWVAVILSDGDNTITQDDGVKTNDRFVLRLNRNGAMTIYEGLKGAGGTSAVGTTTSAALVDGVTFRCRVSYTATNIRWERLDTGDLTPLSPHESPFDHLTQKANS